ncbi:hypothetical protein BH23VER1_BH23VER1_18070 [soil metagenome]
MFEQTFKNLDDVLRKEAGCSLELDYTEQTSWLLFLKYLDAIDALHFRSQQEKHELSDLYESRIKNMGNAGRNGGEYYTPRPLIRAIIRVMKPKIGERIYDGACGSAGFLCEAHDYLRHNTGGKGKGLTASQLQTLQTKTLYGKEKKSLAYVIAIMNLILHGVEAPNIVHGNTLADHDEDVQQKDRYDLILANPPFGGKERKEAQQNFPIKTGETAFLFLQHFIRMLRAGGRGAVVIKNTFLSNSDNASVALRKELLERCNLHTVLDCPGGTFQGAGVKTVVLFFEKGAHTRKVWFYQLVPGRNMGKTNRSPMRTSPHSSKSRPPSPIPSKAGPWTWAISMERPGICPRRTPTSRRNHHSEHRMRSSPRSGNSMRRARRSWKQLRNW